MKASTEELRQILEDLEDETGFLDLDVVIAEARKPESPLHEYFTWDIEKAAYAYWKVQARVMIKKVNYVETTTHIELKIPKYAGGSITNNKAGYRSLDKIR